jgi:nucleoid-associated protein YgaU
MFNPLVIFTGAALATLAALMGVTYDKWSDPPISRSQIVASQEPATQSPAPLSTLRDQAKKSLPEQSEQGPSAKLASISPDEPASPQPIKKAPAAQPQQPMAQPEPPADDSKPTFDTIRVESDGSAVMAGRGVPDSDVTVMLDGKPIGSTKSDPGGAWVLIPEEPVPPGDHQLTLRMQTTDALSIESEQSVALKVPDRVGDEALVVLSDPNQPSKVLQKPETAATQEPLAETTVAASPDAPAAESESSAADETAQSMSLTLGTVDYNDNGDIIFSGTAEPRAGIRLYVDNKPVGDAASSSQGSWTFAGRQEIAVGTHSLRVDQLRPDGSVSQRIELPFMRAAPQEVAALNKSQQQTGAQPAPAAAESNAAAEAAAPVRSAPSSSSEVENPAIVADAEQPPLGSQKSAAAEAELPAAASEPPAAAPAAMEESTDMAAVETPPAAQQSPALQQPSAFRPIAGQTQETAARNGKIVIQPGNSLWRISRVIYGHGIDYTVIYEANKAQIRDPDLIYPGQIFATPGVVPPEMIDPLSTTPLARTSDTPTSQQ